MSVSLSPRILETLDNNRFEAIEKLGDHISSYGGSIAEAAFRHDGRDAWRLLGQVALLITTAISIAGALGKDASADE
jgi:hypothetical protein